jgi:hypothetical protein
MSTRSAPLASDLNLLPSTSCENKQQLERCIICISCKRQTTFYRYILEIDYRKLDRGTLASEKIPRQGADKSSDVQESRLETILKAIAGVHDSVDKRLALVQDAIGQVLNIEQVKEAVSEEMRDVVREQMKVTVQHEIVHAIGEEVIRTVRQ